jgi:aspartyl protease family protein
VNDRAPYIVFYVLAAVFVASSLIGRRLPVGQSVKIGLAWIAIFIVAIAIAVFLRAYL